MLELLIAVPFTALILYGYISERRLWNNGFLGNQKRLGFGSTRTVKVAEAIKTRLETMLGYHIHLLTPK